MKVEYLNRSPNVVVVIGILILGLTTCVWCDDGKEIEDAKEKWSAECPAEEDEGNDVRKQEERILKLQVDREKDIQFLTDIVKNDSDPKLRSKLRVRAVQALGDIRAEEAAGLLIANIDKISPMVFSKTPATMSPCYVALVKIGIVGSLLSLEELGNEMTDFRRDLLTRVVYEVEGYEAGVFLIEMSINSAKDESAKKNLGKALKMIRNFKDIEIHRIGR